MSFIFLPEFAVTAGCGRSATHVSTVMVSAGACALAADALSIDVSAMAKIRVYSVFIVVVVILFSRNFQFLLIMQTY